MAKSKKLEEQTSATKGTTKAAAKVAGPKDVINTVAKKEVLQDPKSILKVGGEPMEWKSRTFITGIGLVSGPVKVGDFARFSELVNDLKTSPMDWISNENEALKQRKARQKEMKMRHGLS